jgi:hypothetical protein
MNKMLNLFKPAHSFRFASPPPPASSSRKRGPRITNSFRRNATLLTKNYITYFGCLVFLLSATHVGAEMALPSLQDIQKKKADLFIEQQRLLSEAETA